MTRPNLNDLRPETRRNEKRPIPAERHGGHTHAAARIAAANRNSPTQPDESQIECRFILPPFRIISPANSQLPVGRLSSSLDTRRSRSNRRGEDRGCTRCDCAGEGWASGVPAKLATIRRPRRRERPLGLEASRSSSRSCGRTVCHVPSPPRDGMPGPATYN